MPINVISEGGAYDPSPSELWNQDAEAKNTVGESLFRLDTSPLSTWGSRLTFGGNSLLSYEELRLMLMPNKLDLFLSEGLVYFHHIIDTSNLPAVGFALLPPDSNYRSFNYAQGTAVPVCGLGIGPDLGNITSLPSTYNGFPTGTCSNPGYITMPTNGVVYGTPGGIQAVKSTTLVPAEGRDASGRVGGYPELFCVDSSTNACMVQYQSGSNKLKGGETLSWTCNLGTSATVTSAATGCRFTPTWSMSSSNFSFSARVVEAYEIESIGYTMVQFSGNVRFTQDQIVNSNGFKFKVIAGGGIPTRAALFGRWEFDEKEVYWIKMIADEDYAGDNKIKRDKKKVKYTRSATTQSDFDEALNKANVKSAADIERAVQSLEGDSKRVTVDRIIAGEDGNLTTEERRNRIAKIKDTDVPGVADKNPITGPILKAARDSLPKNNEDIVAEEQEDRHLIRRVETTGEDIDIRTSPNEASREILTRSGVDASKYEDLGDINQSVSAGGSAFTIEGNVVDPRIDSVRRRVGNLVEDSDQIDKPLRREMNQNLDNKNQNIKEIFDNTLNDVNTAYDNVENAVNVNSTANQKGKATKIYGPTNRFDLVPKYNHPEYTTLQRYDPDDRVNRLFRFTFNLDFWDQVCGPCSEQHTEEDTGETDENGEAITELQKDTCSTARTLSDVSFPVEKYILNNLTPEADIWKQICKDYSGSLQNVTYGDLESQSRGQSDSSNATEGQSYYNESSQKSRIYKDGQWQDMDSANFSQTPNPVIEEEPIEPIFGKNKKFDSTNIKQLTGSTVDARDLFDPERLASIEAGESTLTVGGGKKSGDIKKDLDNNLTGANKSYADIVKGSITAVDTTTDTLNREKEERNTENRNR